jgi:C4-dicarboxylate transporter DctM subunit
MDPWITLALFVAVLLVLLATGAPVAVCMGLLGVLGVGVFVSWNAVGKIASQAFESSGDFVLTVVPLFVLMGEVLARSGLGETLFRASRLWLRALPGSSAVATVAACTAFSSVCGSSPVTAATVGSFAVPEMQRQGYDKRLALGATAAGGTLGILIPPSIPMILYGVITETSVGDLFIAGVIPGLMLAALLSLTVIVLVWRNPALAPRDPTRAGWKDKLQALARLWPVLALIVGVTGSIYSGVATPTEAAALGALGAIAISALQRRLSWRLLRECLDGAARTTAMFLLLLVCGLFVAFLLARLGVPQGLAESLTSLDVPPVVIMVAIVALLVLLGFFMDPLSILVIVVPIFFPAVEGFGYSPVWFGIVVTITIEIAAITPPVGFNLFVLRSVVPGVTMAEVSRGAAVFVLPMLLGIALLFLFPQIALGLLPGR